MEVQKLRQKVAKKPKTKVAPTAKKPREIRKTGEIAPSAKEFKEIRRLKGVREIIEAMLVAEKPEETKRTGKLMRATKNLKKKKEEK